MRPSLAFPLLALAVHGAGACALRSTYLEAFGRGATLPSGSEITLTYAILIATALSGGAAVVAGLYFLVRRDPRRLAIPATVLVCLPTLALSWCYLYAVLVFEGWA